MAAKESALSELHLMLTEAFKEDLRICREEGIPMSASDKAVIVKFLKDNNITADVDADDMKSLTTEFQDELAAKRKAKAEKLLANSESDDLMEALM